MQSIVRKLLVTSFILCVALTTGCSKKSNPMAPEAPPASEYVDVTVTLVRLLAVADGDGIEGEGDFTYTATVYDGTSLVASGSVGIETGNTYTVNRTRVIRVVKGAEHSIVVSFNATEWDTSIFGVTYPDTRMDNLTETRTHTNSSYSAGFNDGERWITLGTGDLQLRLIYTITSQAVV